MPEFHKGMVIELDRKYYLVLDFKHMMYGRGSAHIRAKLRNIETGKVFERTLRESDNFTEVRLDRRLSTYSYKTENFYHFYDTETYEEITLSEKEIEDSLLYLTENLKVEILSIDGKPITIELPSSVTLKVVETEPGVKGDTATGGSKPAKLETGLVVQVPLFINKGESVKVDTRTGKYLERA